MAAAQVPAARDDERLPWHTKLIYGLGDHTVNLALSSAQFFFAFYLTSVVGLRPALAGLVPLIGRAVDAFTDPAMGRWSDSVEWRGGRRRPFFLIGMLPFGLAFAALWTEPATDDETLRFLWYTTVYVAFSLAMTVLAVPYQALVPEMARSYDERTSMNAFRAALAITGTLVAVTTMRPLVEAFGGGSEGWSGATRVFALWLAVPWLLVWLVSFERRESRREATQGFIEGLASLFRHPAYQWLTGLYMLSRVALDLTSAMFIFYFTHWLERPGDFEITMGLFLVSVVIALPIWLRVAQRSDKRTIFMAGAGWWAAACGFMLLAPSDWPRVVIFAVAAVAGAGYAAADMIPWSMLGEVVDEDELRTGQRREGIYFGLFTFLRKLAGAGGVALAFVVLDVVGFQQEGPQNEETLAAIRWLTGGVPGLLGVFAGLIALGYPLTRKRHQRVLEELAQRAESQDEPG